MMNRLCLLIGCLLMLIANMAFAQQSKLIWNDEFNYNGLPDSSKWTYETGHIRNAEKQYYTKQNARVQNGYLVIEARKENHPNQFYDAKRVNWKFRDSLASYTSASITTLGKQYFKYGRVEVRAKLPKGLGVWPAIWMLGRNREKVGFPFCGEIDIMEFVGHDSNHVHASLHYPIDTAGNTASKGGEIKVQQPYNDFHVYAIEWNRKRIDYYFDNSLYHSVDISKITISKSNPFRKPFFLLINLALGGSWGREIDDGILPQQFLIDYVRVYK
jgi:beta-glucanase (GH16 family)